MKAINNNIKEQDLIDTTWKCPMCKNDVTITTDGLQHYMETHFFNYTLRQLVELRNWEKDMQQKFAHQLLYGKDTEQEQPESFYFVNLANSDNTIHHTGKKSRKTGKIYLCDSNYEADLTKPIEETDFHFVRNSTSFDL